MSKISELAYDIEQLYIEGYSPVAISALLNCPPGIVYDWIEGEGLSANEDELETE